jgi:hypothetical protein
MIAADLSSGDDALTFCQPRALTRACGHADIHLAQP